MGVVTTFPPSASSTPPPREDVSDVLVRVRGVCVHFPIGPRDVLKAVDGVDFDVRRGEVFGIIGESGSGKSTLGRAIVALRPPTAGTVESEGVDLARLRGAALRDVRRGYQIVFQDPAGALDPRMTVLQSVREPLDVEGKLPRAERRSVALDCLDKVGLGPDFGARYPHELSGGQKQRVNIARVLTMHPKLVVCDEAVAALDVSTQAEIINLFSRLQRDLGLTYVFISHDLNVVAHLSHRVGVMYLGRLVEIGPVEALTTTPLHPYTCALLQSRPIPVPASMRPQRAPALTGEIPSPIAPPSGCRFRTRCRHAVERCAAEEPSWEEIEPDRWVACHFARELRAENTNNDGEERTWQIAT